MRTIKALVFWVFVMTVSSGVVLAAGMDPWPTKPIELYIGFSAGGAVDLLARAYVPALSKELGVPVVIMYKPGASGAVCGEYVARAKPDGYTIQESGFTIISLNLLTINTHPSALMTLLSSWAIMILTMHS